MEEQQPIAPKNAPKHLYTIIGILLILIIIGGATWYYVQNGRLVPESDSTSTTQTQDTDPVTTTQKEIDGELGNLDKELSEIEKESTYNDDDVSNL